MRRAVKLAAASGLMSGLITLVVMAAEGWLGSIYRADTLISASAVSQAWTNGAANSPRVTLASVFVQCANATNTWAVKVINNSVTSVVKSATLSPASSELLYEGYGMIPVGGGGVVLITGTIDTNRATPSLTNTVNFAIHTRGQ